MAATKSDLVAAIKHLYEHGGVLSRQGTRGASVAMMKAYCLTPECHLCSIIVCPHQDPQHFSSAGCPACKEGE